MVICQMTASAVYRRFTSTSDDVINSLSVKYKETAIYASQPIATNFNYYTTDTDNMSFTKHKPLLIAPHKIPYCGTTN